jgi:hypothetical protein
MTRTPDDLRISQIVTALAEVPRERITLDELLSGLDARAFGMLMLILALPNAVGLGTIPGVSTVFGVPQVLVALQMLAGASRPWLPRWLGKRGVAMLDFRRMAIKAIPHLVRVERLLRPRLCVLTSPLAERLLGLLFLVLASLVAMPIPFANQPPAVAMAIIALGLIEQDGAFVALGIVVALVAIAVALTVGFGIIAGAYFALTGLLGLT